MDRFAKRMSGVRRSFVREILKIAEDPGIISFAGGVPDPRLFPVRELSDAARKVMESGGDAALQYSATEGFLPLRQYIAKRYAKKGIDVGPEEILILSGSQQGIDLVGKAFLDAGDAVIVERPTYLAAIQAFGLYEPVFRAVSLEEDGVNTEELAAALAPPAAKLFYCIPNFQNPTGIRYSEEKRLESVRQVLESPTVLVEDDPYGELGFIGDDLPCMRAFIDDYAPRQPGEATVLLGSFSKIIAPGLRVGWACAGAAIMERLVIAKQASDLHSGTLSQAIVHRYLVDNDVEAHVARIRAAYLARRDLMVELIGKLFPPEVRCTKPEGGMFIWMSLPEAMSALELFERAIARKVAFVPGQTFFTDGGGANTLRLSFAGQDESKTREGMERLARAYSEMAGGG